MDHGPYPENTTQDRVERPYPEQIKVWTPFHTFTLDRVGPTGPTLRLSEGWARGPTPENPYWFIRL